MPRYVKDVLQRTNPAAKKKVSSRAVAEALLDPVGAQLCLGYEANDSVKLKVKQAVQVFEPFASLYNAGKWWEREALLLELNNQAFKVLRIIESHPAHHRLHVQLLGFVRTVIRGGVMGARNGDYNPLGSPLRDVVKK